MNCKSIVFVLLVALPLGGCASFQAYEGPKQPSSIVATVSGDAKVRAQTPLALVIRSIDGKDVGIGYSRVSVLPGPHSLVVDCQVGGISGTASRHAVEFEAFSGVHYRLRAEMRPGNRSCERVSVE